MTIFVAQQSATGFVTRCETWGLS